MARYIDADLILPEMESKLDMQELYLPVHFQEFIVDEIPTADVAPVKHGRWINENFYTRCSACGDMAIYDKYGQVVESDYCPRCGARMDKTE